jgi:hypothetical protein
LALDGNIRVVLFIDQISEFNLESEAKLRVWGWSQPNSIEKALWILCSFFTTTTINSTIFSSPSIYLFYSPRRTNIIQVLNEMMALDGTDLIKYLKKEY